MNASPQSRTRRKRVSRVSYYEHHGSWFLYYREGCHPIRRRVADLDAEILQAYSYDAYGNAIGFDPGQALTAILYSGQIRDTRTGLDWLGIREYDPQRGVFMTDDPYLGNWLNPQTLHKRLYVHGEPFDVNTKLGNNRARWTDLSTGRFLGLDPFYGNMFDPQSFHKYLLVHADPVNFLDPSGLSSLSVTMVSVTIGTLLLTNAKFANAPGPGDQLFDDGDPLVAALPGELAGGAVFRFVGHIALPVFTSVKSTAAAWLLQPTIRELRRAGIAHVVYGHLDEFGRATGITAYLTKDALDAGGKAAREIIPLGFNEIADSGVDAAN